MSHIPVEHRKVLVLNKGWTPLRTMSLIKALNNVCSGKARIVNEDFQAMTWDEWSLLTPLGDDCIYGVKTKYRVPQVIVLNTYDKLPMPKRTFSRRHLFRRDNYTCAYCGEKPGVNMLTVEHIVPKALGGPTNWDNVVTACVDCNSYKACRSPEEAGMTLKKQPGIPPYKVFKMEEVHLETWSKFLSGSSYEIL